VFLGINQCSFYSNTLILPIEYGLCLLTGDPGVSVEKVLERCAAAHRVQEGLDWYTRPDEANCSAKRIRGAHKNALKLSWNHALSASRRHDGHVRLTHPSY